MRLFFRFGLRATKHSGTIKKHIVAEKGGIMSKTLRRLAFALLVGLLLFFVASSVLPGILPDVKIVAAAPKPTKTPGPTATPAPQAGVLITAVYFDPYLTNEPEEAVQLQNVGTASVSIAGWKVSDNEGTVTFPAGASLGAGQKLWVAKTATRFKEEFGFNPGYEYGGNSDASVPDMTGTAPGLANTGDEVILLDASNNRIDVLVYDAGNKRESGWSGNTTVTRYDQGYFGLEGQLLYRKLVEATGLPVADTNTAADWAQTKDDNILGKRFSTPAGTSTNSSRRKMSPRM